MSAYDLKAFWITSNKNWWARIPIYYIHTAYTVSLTIYMYIPYIIKICRYPVVWPSLCCVDFRASPSLKDGVETGGAPLAPPGVELPWPAGRWSVDCPSAGAFVPVVQWRRPPGKGPKKDVCFGFKGFKIWIFWYCNFRGVFFEQFVTPWRFEDINNTKLMLRMNRNGW